MIKMLAKEYEVALPSELLEMYIDLGERLHPCQVTMELYGLSEGRPATFHWCRFVH